MTGKEPTHPLAYGHLPRQVGERGDGAGGPIRIEVGVEP